MELKLSAPLKSVATKRKWSCDVIDGSIVTWCGVKPRATSAPNVHVLISRTSPSPENWRQRADERLGEPSTKYPGAF